MSIKTKLLAILTLLVTVTTVGFVVSSMNEAGAGIQITPWISQKDDRPWKRFDEHTVDPAWTKFQQEHPEYEYHEMEIYRGGQRSVVRFYRPK